MFNHVEFFKFSEFILKEPNRLLVVNGDIINNNLTNSAGSPFDDIISPNDQKKEAVRMLLPLRDRIKVLSGGNHEGRTKKNAGVDVSEEIAEKLGVPYSEDEAFLKYMIGAKPKDKKKFIYTMYMTHGNGGGKRPGSKLNNLEDLSKNILADIYVVGHGHTRLGHKPVFRYPDLRTNKIIEMDQLFTMSAGWLEYGGYPVRKMLRPQKRGAHPVTIYGTHKEVTTTI